MRVINCTKTKHVIDLESVHLSINKGGFDLNARCLHCGEIGFIGTVGDIIGNMSWDINTCGDKETETN